MHNNFWNKKIDRVILQFWQKPIIIIDIKSDPDPVSGINRYLGCNKINDYKRREVK